MAFIDPGAGSPMDTGPPGSSDTGPAGQGGGPGQDMQQGPIGGPVLAALQRQAQGPQVSAPGPGNMADALGKLKIALDLMQSALQGLPQGGPQYKDVLKSLQALARHMPQVGAQQGLEQTHLMDLLRKGRQNPVLQALAGLIGRGGGGGGGPGGGGGGGPQPPMPSTPLPGA